MNEPILVRIDGEVEQPAELTFKDLSAIVDEHQILDVSRLVPDRQGDAVRLQGLLDLARPKANVTHLGLHASADDFHASIPLDAVREKGIVIYRLNGQPLDLKAGGPIRFFIPDHTACRVEEIDECANVKFVDRIELQAGKGFDNRPDDEEEHAKLHEHQREDS